MHGLHHNDHSPPFLGHSRQHTENDHPKFVALPSHRSHQWYLSYWASKILIRRFAIHDSRFCKSRTEGRRSFCLAEHLINLLQHVAKLLMLSTKSIVFLDGSAAGCVFGSRKRSIYTHICSWTWLSQEPCEATVCISLQQLQHRLPKVLYFYIWIDGWMRYKGRKYCIFVAGLGSGWGLGGESVVFS